MIIELIILALLLLFVISTWQTSLLRSKLPPGPFPWPLVGNLFQLDMVKPHVTCYEWSKIYGPVFTIWMGRQPTIIITDYEVMKDALTRHGDQLSSRPKYFLFEHFSNGIFGISMASGEMFKEQKKFSLQVLKNFGLGRNLMQEIVLFESNRLVASIREEMGTANKTVLDLSNYYDACAGSIICSMIFGHPFGKDDEQLKIVSKSLDEMFILVSSFRYWLLNSFPWLRHVPLFGHFGMDELTRLLGSLENLTLKELKIHKEELDKNKSDDEEPRSFVAAYLKEMKRRQRQGEDMSYFSEWQLKCIVDDIWIEAMKNPAMIFRWATLAMIKYPQVQEKVHQEIDAVLGREKMPAMTDRQSMPYVTATLNEINRWGNLSTFNFYHSNDTDFQLCRYTIPKDTHVIPQIGCLAIDEKTFPRPHEFRPERFLEDDGKTLRNVERIAPFSMGKRSCMGEALARAELFLIFVHLMQKFRFSVVPGEKEPTAEPMAGITLAPRPYECLVMLR